MCPGSGFRRVGHASCQVTVVDRAVSSTYSQVIGVAERLVEPTRGPLEGFFHAFAGGDLGGK